MSNPSRPLAAISSVLVAALCVVACSGNSNPTPGPQPAASATPVAGVTPSAAPSATPTATASVTRAQGPCDLYAAATPCAAAFSTTRALFAAFTGSLYQVTRQSDGTTLGIGLLPDGYANASAQDSFCANTTCTITMLYDQTSNHNDLAVAPPGQNATGAGPGGYDLPAVANALPVVAGGHSVYGISIVPGMGYRNDATTGVPLLAQPQGVYMVTSSIPTNVQCCFDFGNAETSNDDKGAGTMDAINIICRGGTPCGDQAGLDLENGIYGSLTVPMQTAFVTDMGENDGKQYYTIWQGNAQSGTLTTTGPLTLPAGYSPMKQQGAIILGIGGDNSDFSPGYFFEGVMTQGTPSSAVMSSVQTNIIAAAYATSQSSTPQIRRARR